MRNLQQCEWNYNKSDEVVCDEIELKDCWKEYFKDLYGIDSDMSKKQDSNYC